MVTSERTQTAKVYGGHYHISFDISVFTRDPQSVAELADHIIGDIWGNRRLQLEYEGITFEELEASGESEDSYDEATGTLFFTQSISATILTEWKKFVPYVVDLRKFDITLHRMQEQKIVVLDENGNPVEVPVGNQGKELVIQYPKKGYPKYF